MATKKEEYLRKIRDLGSLPATAFEAYQKYTIKKLYDSLTKCNEKLKAYRY
jgi:structural maintenance of chromosome 3 (chondroitin sulfate proteoglycan 6)